MVVFLFTLAACGGPKTETQPQTETQATSSETKSPEAKQAETAAENEQTASEPAANGSKTLVVYFSATGTTKGVAEQIASAANADTYQILAAQEYTADDLNWNDQNSRTTIEQNDKSVRPAIGSETLSLSTAIRPFSSAILSGGAKNRASWIPSSRAMTSRARPSSRSVPPAARTSEQVPLTCMRSLRTLHGKTADDSRQGPLRRPSKHGCSHWDIDIIIKKRRKNHE